MNRILLAAAMLLLPLAAAATRNPSTVTNKEQKAMVRTFTTQEIRGIKISTLAPQSDLPGMVWGWLGCTEQQLSWGNNGVDEPSNLCFDAFGSGKHILLYIDYYHTAAAAKASRTTEGSCVPCQTMFKNMEGSFTGRKIGEDVHHVDFYLSMNVMNGVKVDPYKVVEIGLVARDGDVCVSMIEDGPPNYVFTALDKWMLENTAIDIFKRAAVYGMTAVTKPNTPLEQLPAIEP